jgi:uncharacterized membrane protein
MQELLRFFGHGFCHQIPGRCFESGGLLFSVCARDTGIYMGFALAILAAFLVYARHRQKPGELPPWPCLVVFGLFVLPMAFDGGTSYLGLRPTNNTIRYFTGFFTGYAAGGLIAPLLMVLRKDADSKKRAFSKPSELLLHLLASFGLGTLFFFTYPLLGPVSPFIVLAAFLCIAGSVNMILLTLSRRFAPKHSWRHWALLMLLALGLSVLEASLFWAAREVLQQLLLGGRDIAEFYPNRE